VLSQIDIASLVIGIMIGVVPTIVAYEYQRWRERSTRAGERKKEAGESIRSELTKFVSGWQLFKNTPNMQVEQGLANYRFELEQLGHGIRDVLSVSEGILPRDLSNEGMMISGDLIKMSVWEFYADGGVSFNRFIKLGDETAKRCEELGRRLR
jgi:hypothetical protein